MADVRLEGLRKCFGEQVAVEAVDLAIAAGEFFSLLGPSGCGKTTTLRLIAGLEEPTAGRIWLGGEDVSRLPAHRRDIGLVFQNYALFPHLDVGGNVAYGLRARRVRGDEARRRVAEALARVALAGFERRRVSQLSGGQQQRVAVARATVIRPRVLLLDEPLSNLDARLRVETRAMLRQVQQELGSTAVYVTHDQEEALALSDRLAVLNHGRVEQVGRPEELYDRPASRFVAAFIGRANLVAGTVTGVAGETCRVRLAAGPEIEAARGAARPEVGRPATVCLRPEALRVGEGPVRGRVVGQTFTGPWRETHVAVGEETWLAVEPHRPGPGPGVGDEVPLAVQWAVLVPEES